MKKAVLSITIVLISFVLTNAQGSSPQTDAQKEARLEKERQYNNRVDALRNNGKTDLFPENYKNSKIYLNKIKPLYRVPDKEEEILLAPDSTLVQKFSEFLSQKNTGLIKLIIDKGCDKGTQIVDSSEHCTKYKMPGAAASYSFRTGNYQVKHLSDISFSEGNFVTTGLLKHGILINIGDVSLENVNLQMEQLKTLTNFHPVKESDKAEILAAQLEKGIQGDFLYKDSLPVEENKTYILRSIAYKGNNFKVVEDVEYDEFDFDDRKDVIVAFRVVKLNKDESVTILWKELSSQKTSKLKFKDQ